MRVHGGAASSRRRLVQSWVVALTILNLCLISAVMALGVNIQWGYAGLFNTGIMGFAALGGVGGGARVDAAGAGGARPGVEPRAGGAGGGRDRRGGASSCATRRRRACAGRSGCVTVAVGYFVMRMFLDPASEAIEAIDPASAGYLGGLGLPVLSLAGRRGCLRRARRISSAS